MHCYRTFKHHYLSKTKQKTKNEYWKCFSHWGKNISLAYNFAEGVGLLFLFKCTWKILFLWVTRGVASLAVPGGQEIYFPHFSSNFHDVFFVFLKIQSFWTSFGLSEFATSGKALYATVSNATYTIVMLLQNQKKNKQTDKQNKIKRKEMSRGSCK